MQGIFRREEVRKKKGKAGSTIHLTQKRSGNNGEGGGVQNRGRVTGGGGEKKRGRG